MTGTWLNVATVAAGATLGALLGDRLPARVRDMAMTGIGLVTLLVGAQMALQTKHLIVVLLSLLLGGLIGELLGLEAALERLGAAAQKRFARGATGHSFAEGFVASTLLFCVGPVTLLGCLNDGLRGDWKLLALKSALDFISAIAFASALGWGVLLSAASVLAIQGSLTLGARFVATGLTEERQVEMFAVGGLMMIGLALRLLELKPVRVANFSPALVVAPVLTALVTHYRWPV